MNFPTLLQLDAKLNLGHERRRGDQPQGRAGRPHDHGVEPRGVRRPGRLRDPDGRAWAVAPSRRSSRARRSNTACSASRPTSGSRNRVIQVTPHSPAARGPLQVNDEIMAVNGVPVTDFDSLILAVSAYSPGDSVRLKIRRSDEIIERTIVLAKYPVEGEVIATNRPRPWRGLRVDYTSALRLSALGLARHGPDGRRRGRHRRRGGLAGRRRRPEEGRHRSCAWATGPVQSPRAFAEAVAGQDGPVVLDTDIGVLTVGNGDSSRPKPADPPRRGR